PLRLCVRIIALLLLRLPLRHTLPRRARNRRIRRLDNRKTARQMLDEEIPIRNFNARPPMNRPAQNPFPPPTFFFPSTPTPPPFYTSSTPPTFLPPSTQC